MMQTLDMCAVIFLYLCDTFIARSKKKSQSLAGTSRNSKTIVTICKSQCTRTESRERERGRGAHLLGNSPSSGCRNVSSLDSSKLFRLWLFRDHINLSPSPLPSDETPGTHLDNLSYTTNRHPCASFTAEEPRSRTNIFLAHTRLFVQGVWKLNFLDAHPLH